MPRRPNSYVLLAPILASDSCKYDQNRPCQGAYEYLSSTGTGTHNVIFDENLPASRVLFAAFVSAQRLKGTNPQQCFLSTVFSGLRIH